MPVTDDRRYELVDREEFSYYCKMYFEKQGFPNHLSGKVKFIFLLAINLKLFVEEDLC